MGRVRTFDEDAVVRAARGLFWEQGYAETAVPDLERVTGLGRSSLYHAFGSKRGLFDAAVESYLAEVVRPRLAPLLADEVAPDALEAYLVGLREAVLAGASEVSAHGCLLMNSTASTLARDETVQGVVSRYYADLRAAVAAGVGAARPDLDRPGAEALTTTVAALVLSSMMIVRVSPASAAEVLETARGAVVG